MLLAILLSGCYTKDNQILIDEFNVKSNKLAQTLQTQKVVILNAQKEVDGLVTALYLYDKNGKVIQTNENEKFIVGIYNDARNDNIPAPLVTLMGVKPISMQKLNYDDPRLSTIPLRNRWSRYYLVIFPPYNINNEMELKVNSYGLGEVALSFLKSLNFSK